MMNKVAIVIGVGVFVVTVVACCFCWGLWKLGHRMRATGQISVTPEELPVENRKGLQKDVVLTFPTMNINSDSKSQCRICLLEFREDEDVRKLSECEHMFHNRCINPVLRNRQTCPICSRRVASENPKEPPWILVNQPVPLPRTALVTSSSSSERFEIELTNANSVSSSKGESPLLKHQDDDDECVDISFTFGADIPVEKRQQIYNAKTFDHSFSFSFPAPVQTRHSRSSSRTADAGYGGDQVPLTKSPQHCSFEVLPVFTSSSPLKVGSHRSSYSQL